MSDSHRSARNGSLCVLIFLACFSAARPIAEMGFVDDWSYAESARVFARTGHLVYNGWATAMLGWQIPWGALFIRLFGFSFTTVKLSTLPVAAATVFLFYVIHVRFGITPRNAVIGTLTLGLSPLFLPLAASFMSDIPGLFVVVLCLYCCQRAVAASSNAFTITWLTCAVASNVIGGTTRQIAWLGALVMVPSTAWLLRKRHGVLQAASLLWVTSIAAVLAFMGWFARQPYSVPEAIFSGSLQRGRSIAFLFNYSAEFLCLVLVVFPILVAWLPQIRKASGATRLLFTCILALWAVAQWLMKWTLPWTQHILRAEFSANRIPSMRPDVEPLVFPVWVCLLASLLVAAAVLAFVRVAIEWLREPRSSAADPQLGEIFWLCGPFTISYFLLLLPRAWYPGVLDRYLLPLMPIAILWLIRLYQKWITGRLPVSSMVTMALFAFFAVAGTHDWFAWQRARLAAIARIETSGVSRATIQGGVEFDGWTQIENGGHINDPRIAVPPSSWLADSRVPQVAAACRFDFAPYTPSVQPRFTIVFAPLPCLSASGFPPVPYRAWLPPFQRWIYIERIP